MWSNIMKINKKISQISFIFFLAVFANKSSSSTTTWDFDHDGNVDALTDGLLLLRYTFNLRGEFLTADAISSTSLLTSEEVETNIAEATNGLADIDGSGDIDALTDGLLLLRYLFNLRGDSLITNAVKANVVRANANDIENYILQHMPNSNSAVNLPEISETPYSDWMTGEYKPSSNYANRCINPRSNNDYQDLVGTYVDENNWLRSWSHETYLWYSELPDIDPILIEDPNAYFDLMKTNATTSNGMPKDRFHYAVNTEEYNQYTETGVFAGYGFDFIFLETTPPRKAIIIFSEPNSPASDKNIKRGAEIISVDGQALDYGDADIINTGLFPEKLGENHSFEIKDLNTSTTRTVVLQSSEILTVPVHTQKIIERADKKIGYLILNSFFVADAEKQLIDAMDYFKNNQIDELILDLRYNGGGYISMSEDLGTMIAGNTAIGSVFTEITLNDKLSNENTVFRFSSASSSDLSVPYGTDLPKLDLPRVYIIATENTASASEYLINGLRGIDIEVILIGSTTTGKPYGWVPEDNCGTTYSTIQFKGENAKGYGDFADGFVPSFDDNGTDRVRGCLVSDDLTKLLGDESEHMLATALFFVDNNECPVSAHNVNTKPTHPFSTVSGEVISRFPGTGLLLQSND
jgi:carboxyl-terminal processing protease